MLSVPPPNSGSAGLVLITLTVVEVMFCASARFFRMMWGLSKIACVMVPAAIAQL